jgi:putative ABC transport system substrate-binding protein
MMSRRTFLFGLTFGMLSGPLAAEAQAAGKIARIGVLVTGPPPGEHACVLALRRGFADLGYVEGGTYVLEIRWAEGRPEEAFPRFGAELVRLGVDLIVSVTSLGLVEAKHAIASVPVVMAASTHPVERRLVASLSHPGGNITGLATFTGEMFAKRVQLLAEVVPGVSRVAVLRLPGDQNDLVVRDLEMAARRLGLKLQVIEVRSAGDFPGAFQAAVRGGAQAIMTAQGPFFLRHLRQTAELAMKHKLPSFSGEPTAADAGMLMSSGASIPASCHRAAYFVDRILKGAKPVDLPIEQSTKFNLEINLKTATALGLTVPQSVLIRADRVIQ